MERLDEIFILIAFKYNGPITFTLYVDSESEAALGEIGVDFPECL